MPRHDQQYRDQAFCDPGRTSGWNTFSTIYRAVATAIGKAGGSTIGMGEYGAAMGASVPDSCTNVWIKDLPGNVWDHRTGFQKENVLLGTALVLLMIYFLIRYLK